MLNALLMVGRSSQCVYCRAVTWEEYRELTVCVMLDFLIQMYIFVLPYFNQHQINFAVFSRSDTKCTFKILLILY